MDTWKWCIKQKKEIAQFYTKVAETKKQNYKDYVDSNKKRTNNWLKGTRLQLPFAPNNLDSIGNIPQKNTSVNTQNEKSLKNVPKFSINVDKSNSANYNESEQYGVMWTLESGALNKKEIA